MSQQFEEAIAYLVRTEHYAVEAVHFAIALVHYGALNCAHPDQLEAIKIEEGRTCFNFVKLIRQVWPSTWADAHSVLTWGFRCPVGVVHASVLTH